MNTFAKCYKEFNLQKYLDFNIPKSLVKNITKLRISAHTFLIEKGRYRRSKLPRDLRQCRVCTQIEVRVITKLPNSEQSYKGKVKTHNYINKQNQSTELSLAKAE